MKNFSSTIAIATFGSLMLLGLNGCGKTDGSVAANGSGTSESTLSGSITIDGSSTVQPIMSGIAEDFDDVNEEVRTTVAESGTGGGFKKFCNGEIDIANASRPIKPEEIEACTANKIEFVEVPVAFDGLSVVVNPQNDWMSDITVDELKMIWQPNSKVKMWSDVRPAFPKEQIKLYGPGTSSGTFDYFTEAIVGKKGESRPDYTQSEKDDVLVTGVAGDKNSLGYFGYAYYENNRAKLKLLAVNGVKPAPQTVVDGTYTPLSRPLFAYASKAAMEKPQVVAFLKYVLSQGKEIIREEGYVPLPDEAYAACLARLEKKTVGSVFQDVKPGMKIEDVLKRESSGK